MFLFRKNIILVPSDYDGISMTKGLLSLDAFDDRTKCTLRSYNLDIDKNLLLGVAVGKKLNKIEINSRDKSTDFELDFPIKNTDEISCVLLDIGKDDYSILLWGSTQINSEWKSSLELMLENENILPQKNKNFSQNVENQSTEQKVFNKNFNDSNYEFSKNFEKQTDNQESKKTDKKENDTSKLFEYDEEKLNTFVDSVLDMSDETNGILDKKNEKQNFTDKSEISSDETNFFDRINLQVQKMFSSNPSEKILDEIIPNSKFCRVEFDDKTGYYVFGVVYDDEKPKYLCYGLPAKKDSEPPKELSEFYQWLPIEAENENGDGFYMMYQDADTGKSISVEVV